MIIQRPNWCLYVGRDYCANRSASIQFGYGFRPDAEPGIIKWRHSIYWSWNWMPVKLQRLPDGWLLHYGQMRRIFRFK